MNDQQHLRIGDAEREQAASDLGEHYAQGRLSADEHGERLDRVWAARTRGELAPVFGDLPGHGTTYAAPRQLRARPMSWRRGLPTPVVVVLAVLVVLTVATHLPLVVLGLLAWFFVASRRRHGLRPDGPGRGFRRRGMSAGV